MLKDRLRHPLLIFVITRFRRMFRDMLWKYSNNTSVGIVGQINNTPEKLFWNKVNLLISSTDTNNLIEMGCQTGRGLCKLSRNHNDFNFTGIDINKKSIQQGNDYIRINNIRNVQLINENILSYVEKHNTSIDVFCSCASLIYLSEKQVVRLLKLLKEKNVKHIYFCEVTSLTSKTIFTHIFIHPFTAILKKYNYDKVFNIDFEYVDYPPWEGREYKGAMHFLTRKNDSI